MVEDSVTDGERIAQLLASELAGRKSGPLAQVSVVDVDRDAEPSPRGTVAYGVAVGGTRVADVVMYPRSVALETVDGTGAFGRAVRRHARDVGLPADDGRPDDDGKPVDDGRPVAVRVMSGAAVKRAVDAVVAGVRARGGD
ncbi:MAG: hypothetical protein ABEJ40_04195 [Haloarculaceae archaeon]